MRKRLLFPTMLTLITIASSAARPASYQDVLIDQDGIIRARGVRAGALSSKIGDLIKKLPKQENAGTQ